MRRKTKGRLGPIDKCVAERIKNIRTTNDQTRASLAEFLDLSSQQVQKYEYGKSVIAVSTLYKISEFLRVPVGALFDGMPETSEPTAWEDQLKTEQNDFMSKPENVRLVSTFMRIGDLRLRRKIFVLIDELSQITDDTPTLGGVQ